MRSVKRLSFRHSLLLFALLAVSFPHSASAQGSVSWSEPTNLSVSATSSMHPVIVSDAYGFVHVFWSEDMNGREITESESGDPPNTIMYRRWDGQVWGEAIDIIAVPGDTLADFVAVTLDNKNQLHLVWTGLTQLYYSTAPASDAHSVRAWSTPQVIAADSARSAYETEISADSRGDVHIVFATRGSSSGVYHSALTSGSDAWSAPVRISDVLRPMEVAFMDVRLIIDAVDRLHAAWATANVNGYSQAVYYGRSEHAGQLWDPPVMLADATIDTGFTGFPSMLAIGQDELLLIHVDQSNKGRIERTSVDAGRTWSAPRVVLPEMEGVNGFVVPLQDRGGNNHLIINMRPIADQRTGIYYAPRSGIDWTPVVAIAIDELSGSSAHYTDATVRLGNEIHTVWTQLHQGEIWHMRGIINGLESIPSQPIRPQTPSKPTPARPVQAMASAAFEKPVTPVTPQIGPTAAQPARTATTVDALMVAIVPVLLLVGVTVLRQLRKR